MKLSQTKEAFQAFLGGPKLGFMGNAVFKKHEEAPFYCNQTSAKASNGDEVKFFGIDFAT